VQPKESLLSFRVTSMELLSGFNFPLPAISYSTGNCFPSTNQQAERGSFFRQEDLDREPSKHLRTLEPSPFFFPSSPPPPPPVTTTSSSASPYLPTTSSQPGYNFEDRSHPFTTSALPNLRLPPIYLPEPPSATVYHTTSSTHITTTTTLATSGSSGRIQPQTGPPSALSRVSRINLTTPTMQQQSPQPVRYLPQKNSQRSFIMMPATAYCTGLGGVGGIAKKPRKKVTPSQLAILEEAFDEGMIPDLDTRNKLASQLGFSERRVRVWFQNRRAKLKKDNQSSQVFVTT